MTNQQRRLYRSRTNKLIGGVCGGIGEYLNMDVTIIRLGWILLTLLGGSGIIAYIIAYFIIPPQTIECVDSNQPIRSDFTAARILGILFVAIGTLILLDNLNIFSFRHWWDISEEYMLPGILILIGIYFLTKQKQMPISTTAQTTSVDAEPQSNNQAEPKEPLMGEKEQKKVFRRSLTDKKFLGICGGLSEYFNIDSSIVRIGFAFFTLLSGGIGVILYFLMYLIVPESQPQTAKQQ